MNFGGGGGNIAVAITIIGITFVPFTACFRENRAGGPVSVLKSMLVVVEVVYQVVYWDVLPEFCVLLPWIEDVGRWTGLWDEVKVGSLI